MSISLRFTRIKLNPRGGEHSEKEREREIILLPGDWLAGSRIHIQHENDYYDTSILHNFITH